MNCYKYGYLLTISDDEGFLIKYDYILTNNLTLNNSAVYDYLSGIDLSRYNLNDKEDNEDFISNVIELNNNHRLEQINILDNLVNELPKFLEA